MSEIPSTAPEVRIEPFGDSALRLVLGDTLDPVVNLRVCALADRIATAAADGRLPGVAEVLPAFAVVGIQYRAEDVALAGRNDSPFAALSRSLRALLADAPPAPDEAPVPCGGTPPPRTVEIPVCYGGAFGPDLEDTAAHCGLSPDALVALHQQPSEEQRVYMIGFAPGGPYIGRLDAALAIARRPTPRTVLPMGTVCIANRQSVVYPVAAPGGWHMIGRTPLRLFDPAREEPCLLRPGDRIRFRSIDADAFARALREAGA